MHGLQTSEDKECLTHHMPAMYIFKEAFKGEVSYKLINYS